MQDQFDELAKARHTVGAHRTPRRVNPWIVALLLVVLLSPALGIGAGFMFGNNSSVTALANKLTNSSASTTTKKTTTVKKTTTESESSTDTETAETSTDTQAEQSAPAPTPPAPEINFSSRIEVLNGSGITGYARQSSDTLNSGGYTSVTPGNYQYGEPTVSTVYYRDASMSSTAQDVARRLGITAVELLPSAVPNTLDVVVVLRG